MLSKVRGSCTFSSELEHSTLYGTVNRGVCVVAHRYTHECSHVHVDRHVHVTESQPMSHLSLLTRARVHSDRLRASSFFFAFLRGSMTNFSLIRAISGKRAPGAPSPSRFNSRGMLTLVSATIKRDSIMKMSIYEHSK